MAQTDGTLRFDTKIDNSGFEEGINRLNGIADKSFSALTYGITAATAALGAGAAAAVDFGSAFETSMAKASTLFGDVAVDTARLNSEILALSNSTGLAAATYGEALYSALSAGIAPTEDMSDALTVLDNSAKLAVAGFTDIDTALSATTKVLNAYGLSAEEAARVQGILIQTQNVGETTVGELGAALSQCTPTAAAFGLSFEQVGASLSVITAQGTSTAQATTQLNALISELGKSGTTAAKNLAKAAEGTEYAGMSFIEMMDAGADLGEVLGMISDEAGEDNLTLLDMFSSIEAGRAALSLFSQEGSVFTSALESMYDTEGLVQAGFDKMMNTFEGQKSVFIESAKNLAISVYNEMSQPLTGMMRFGNDILAQLTDAFSQGGAEGLISAVGTVLGDVVVEVVGYAPEVIDAGLELLGSLAFSLIDSAPLLLETGVELSQALISGLFGEELGEAAGELGQTVLVTFGLMGDIIAETTGTVTPLLGDTAMAILEVVNFGLKPINATLKLVSASAKGLTAVVLAGAAGWTAYMIVQKAQKATSAMSAAMVLLKGATDKETVSTMLSTGALTAKQVIVGTLTGKIGIATAAQALWNAVIMANPIGLLVAAIVALIAVVAGLVIHLVDSSDEAEANARQIERLTNEIDGLCDAQWELYDSYDSLRPQIHDVNSLLSDSGKTLSQVNDDISAAEDGISSVLSAAISQRRELREADLTALRQYLDDYKAAVEEQLGMYMDVQQAQNAKIKWTPPQDAEDIAQYNANLQEAYSDTLESIDQLYTQGITQIENLYSSGFYASNEQYYAAMEAEASLYQDRLAAAEDYYNDGHAMLQQYASEQVSEMWSFNVQLAMQAEQGAITAADFAKQYLENLDADAVSQFWYTMKESIENGSDLTNSSVNAVANMLAPFVGLEGEMAEMGKDTLLGMIGGIQDEIPALSDTSEMTCDQIVGAIKDYFGIHSPSTLMYEYGGYIVEGLINGITDRSGELNAILNGLTMDMPVSGSVGLSLAGAAVSGASSAGLSAPLAEAGRKLVEESSVHNAKQLDISASSCERLLALAASAAATLEQGMAQMVSATQTAASSIVYNTSTTNQSFTFNTPTARPSAVARAAREAMEVK